MGLFWLFYSTLIKQNTVPLNSFLPVLAEQPILAVTGTANDPVLNQRKLHWKNSPIRYQTNGYRYRMISMFLYVPVI